MKKWKKIVSICMACAMLSGTAATFAESVDTNEAVTEAVADGVQEETMTTVSLEGQLTLEDLSALNGGEERVFSHNGHVTFVAGTCTDSPVTNEEEAAAVVASMMSLIGADAGMEFIPWRTIADPLGNNYYIFQQMYENTTVSGGAVKVITDAQGNMIALTSSVEAEMPEVTSGTGITAQEAEQIVAERELETTGLEPEILGQYTDTVILPSFITFDINSEDVSSRFVWIVYSRNSSANVTKGTDLPYLAHYVTMSGEYLYNMPAIAPDDEASRSGYDSSYVFEFMEPVDYTGYVDLSDGSEKEITVTVMRDKRTGMYYLGNIERRIVVAQCYDFLYDEGKIVLESSPDNMEWDQVGLLSLYNYCRAWDYYNEIGWKGGDGLETPIIILNNFCDDHYNEVNNACYVGKVYGMQAFLASKINDFSQCLDIIAHEFTHCVTHSVMTYNSYMNDFGAINEAMSDIQGKNCEMMAGDVEPTNWVLGCNSKTPARNMEDPHRFQQPEYTWDLYYKPKVETPTAVNDHGGVHTNSSLLNRVSSMLIAEGNMTFDEARTFWFMADCAMVPGTDYAQLAELLPWVLKTAGMQQYEETLAKAIGETRLGEETMPETINEDRALLTLHLPDTEAFDGQNWMMMLTSIKVDQMISRIRTLASQFNNEDYSALPESVRRFIEENQRRREEERQKFEEDPVGTTVTSLLGFMDEILSGEGVQKSAADDEEMKAMLKDLLTWIGSELREVFFNSYGIAGQDGSTVNMIVRPGRSVPILQHATVIEGSDKPDQVVMAAYIHGKWYDLMVSDIVEAQKKEIPVENLDISSVGDEIIKDILGENLENIPEIRSLDDFLDLFTVNIKGGETLEISSEGLDKIVIPEPTPAEDKPFGTITPGAKSRPKTDETEALTEAETQAEELDDAA